MPELTIIERAQKALSIEHTEAQLKAMAKKSADVKAIKDDTDYQLVKSSRINLKNVRVSIQKAGKAAREDATKFSKAVISEEKRLLGHIQPEEQRLQTLQTEKDQEAEREAERVRKIEEERVADIVSKIQGIKEQAEGLLGADSGEILRRLQTANAIPCDGDNFSEYVEQAKEVCIQTAQALSDAYNTVKAQEEQRAEQDRIAREQAERQAELDRQAEEQRKQQQAEQDRIDAREAEIKRQQDEIDAQLKAEEDRKMAEERAEAERIRQENERLKQEKEDQILAERKVAEEHAEKVRQEALRPEKERLIDWVEGFNHDIIEIKDKELKVIQAGVVEDIERIVDEAIILIAKA